MTRRPRRPSPADPANQRPRPTPWEDDAEGASSFGSWLRQQREMRHIGLREISDSTKIGVRYLEALEENRFEVLPANVFAKGFLREYAKYVGLDPHDVVNYYLLAADLGGADGEEETEPPAKAPASDRRPLIVLVVLLLVVLLAVTLVSLLAERRQGESAVSPVAPPPIPTPRLAAANPTPTPPERSPATPLRVTLDFTGECWVEAKVDGDWQVSERKVQGESLQLEGEKEVVLKTLGNAGAVRVEVNGFPLHLRGGAGEVVHDVVIDLGTARALSGAGEGSTQVGPSPAPSEPGDGRGG